MAGSWIGGDIAGLRGMGQALTSAQADLEEIVKPLSSKVDSLVGDAGWQGDAAEQFRAKWSEDAVTAGGLSELVGSVGSVLTTLASNLASCESALYNAAHAAQARGVSVGPRGEPLPMATSTPPTPAEQAALGELSGYSEVYRSILQEAQKARVTAAEQLKKRYEAIDPAEPMKAADAGTVFAFLRDLYGAKDDIRSKAAEKARTELDQASRKTEEAWASLSAEQEKLKAAGQEIPKDLPQDAAYRRAIQDVKALDGKLTAIEDSRTVVDKAINYKLADAARDLRSLQGLDHMPEFLRDIPVLDIGAAAVTTVAEAKDDHDKGWSWRHSYLVDGAAAVGGLAAGAAIVALAPEEVEGAAGLAATYGGVAVGVLATTVAIDKAFHEHWSEDIHDHGVIGGLWAGGQNVVVGTGKTLLNDAKDVWNAVF